MIRNNVLDALGNVVDILRGDTADGDTSVLGHVNAVFLDHSLALLNGESREGEHANLSGNVRPVTWDALLLNCSAKGSSHFIHAAANGNKLVEPLLAQSRVIEDSCGDSSTMLGRRRVVAADNDLDLREDTSGLVLVSTDKVEGASALTIETHNLGERLGNDHIEALGEEETETVCILVEAARGEALVCGIKEWVELSALADISNLLPLSLSGVDAGRVVSAGVQKHARAGLSSVEISDHASDIETLGLLVEVAVLAHGDASRGEHLVVVAPGRVAHVEGAGSELSEELSNDAQSASTGQGLHGSDSCVADEGAVEAEEDTLGALAELSETIDGQILLIKSGISDNCCLSLADDGEDVGLAVVVAVGTDTKVDLLGVLVGLEALSQTEDRVSGGHGDVSELSVQCSESGCHLVKSLFYFIIDLVWLRKLGQGQAREISNI